jgi:hypothetical protein
VKILRDEKSDFFNTFDFHFHSKTNSITDFGETNTTRAPTIFGVGRIVFALLNHRKSPLFMVSPKSVTFGKKLVGSKITTGRLPENLYVQTSGQSEHVKWCWQGFMKY